MNSTFMVLLLYSLVAVKAVSEMCRDCRVRA